MGIFLHLSGAGGEVTLSGVYLWLPTGTWRPQPPIDVIDLLFSPFIMFHD